MIFKIKDITLCNEAKTAKGFKQKLLGLMFQDKMNGYDGLLIKRCNSIHTFFMKMSIDAIFLDSSFTVVRVYRNLRPWKMTRIVWGATQVLELNSGAAPRELAAGDKLEVCTN